MARIILWEPAAAVCERHPEVLAAWVFGSAKEGEVRDGGDLDLGFLFDEGPDLDALVLLRADLQQALQFDNIDVVPLNQASPILQFEAISGASIYCRDLEQRAEFVSLVARQYEDEMVFYRKGLRHWEATGRSSAERNPLSKSGLS